jgi:hypothetical protein
MCNYGKSYHCHLSKKFTHFSDGGGLPQGRLPQLPQGIKVASIVAKPTSPSLDHLMKSQGQGNRKSMKLFEYFFFHVVHDTGYRCLIRPQKTSLKSTREHREAKYFQNIRGSTKRAYYRPI